MKAIFYGQIKLQCSSVEHMGDNKTGSGDGDTQLLNWFNFSSENS